MKFPWGSIFQFQLLMMPENKKVGVKTLKLGLCRGGKANKSLIIRAGAAKQDVKLLSLAQPKLSLDARAKLIYSSWPLGKHMRPTVISLPRCRFDQRKVKAQSTQVPFVIIAKLQFDLNKIPHISGEPCKQVSNSRLPRPGSFCWLIEVFVVR